MICPEAERRGFERFTKFVRIIPQERVLGSRKTNRYGYRTAQWSPRSIA
jgi:hypothetical protein